MTPHSPDPTKVISASAHNARKAAVLFALVVGLPGSATVAGAQSTAAGPLVGTRPQFISTTYLEGQQTDAKIVNGILTTWYPSVGALLYRSKPEGFGSWCTGTFIGCTTFLTAGHCINQDQDVSKYKVFLQHAGLFDVKSISWQQNLFVDPNPSTGAEADIAVLTLTRPVNGIRPHAINEEAEHGVGQPGTIVGFGRTGGERYDYGLKRYGQVSSAKCRQGFTKDELVCWNYRGQRLSNTCNGDSGGPLFLSEGRPFEVISGVTSGGINTTCQQTDHSFDTSVFQHRDWIKSVAGADLANRTCGPLAPLAERETDRYWGVSGQLGASAPQHVLEIDVASVNMLRVGVNFGMPADLGDQAFAMKPELYVLKGKTRDLARPACVTKPSAQAAFCEVEKPDSGAYTVVLKRGGATGVADFQLTVSLF